MDLPKLRHIVSVLLLVMGCALAHAQDNDMILNRPYADTKLLHFGFSVGMNFQNLAITNNGFITDDDEEWYADIPAHSPGFSVNVLADLRLARSAGSMHPDLHIGDLVMAMGACTNSAYAEQFRLPGTYAPIADFDLLRAAAEKAEELGYRYKVGNVYSSDTFYDDSPDTDQWQKMGVLAVEMEAPALYMNAARSGARALCMCTISDSLITGEVTTAEERQNNFTQMMDVAFGII